MSSAALPLAGKRVVVTQACHQAPELAALLAAQGAEPLLYPCIVIEPPADTQALDRALADAAAGRFDWVVLTSANTVRSLAQRTQALGLPRPTWGGMRVAAIGDATAEAAVMLLGCEADLIANESVAEGLAQTLLLGARPGQRVLLPQGDLARPVLAQTLTAGGLEVVSVAVYRTTVGSGGVDLPALLAARTKACGPIDRVARTPTCGSGDENGVDAITFTSSSTVRNLLARLEQESGDPPDVIRARLAGICLAAIGPITAQTLYNCGLPATVVAQEQSLEGLVAALVNNMNRITGFAG